MLTHYVELSWLRLHQQRLQGALTVHRALERDLGRTENKPFREIETQSLKTIKHGQVSIKVIGRLLR